MASLSYSKVKSLLKNSKVWMKLWKWIWAEKFVVNPSSTISFPEEVVEDPLFEALQNKAIKISCEKLVGVGLDECDGLWISL